METLKHYAAQAPRAMQCAFSYPQRETMHSLKKKRVGRGLGGACRDRGCLEMASRFLDLVSVWTRPELGSTAGRPGADERGGRDTAGLLARPQQRVRGDESGKADRGPAGAGRGVQGGVANRARQ